MISLRREQLYQIPFIIISFALIYSYSTIYMCIDFARGTIISTILIVIGVLLCLLGVQKYKVKKEQIYFLIIMFVVNIMYLALRRNGSLNAILILGVLFPIFVVFNYYLEQKQIIKKFCKVFVIMLTVLASISLCYWLFGSILGILKPEGSVIIDWGIISRINKYSVFYYTPQFADINFGGMHIGVRNCSIFAEAPMASSFFSVALLLNEFYVKYKNKVINAILVVTIITTLSVTGWITLIILFVYKIINLKIKSKIGYFIKYSSIIIAMICSVGLIMSLFSTKLASGSGIDRMSHILEEILAFKKNILIGNGFNMYTNGSSNSFFALLADGGLLLFSIYYIPILGILVYDFIIYKKFIYFIFTFFAMFLITAVQYNILTIFIITLMWNILLQRMFKKNKYNQKYNYLYIQ